MSPLAEATFQVVGWDQAPAGSADDSPVSGRAVVRKQFSGSLSGESTADLLMWQASDSGPDGGAGYVASERVVAELDGRSGTFVIQHWGITGGGGDPRTGGHVVPGSGTGELEGLQGTIEIRVDADGTHHFAIDYELG